MNVTPDLADMGPFSAGITDGIAGFSTIFGVPVIYVTIRSMAWRPGQFRLTNSDWAPRPTAPDSS